MPTITTKDKRQILNKSHFKQISFGSGELIKEGNPEGSDNKHSNVPDSWKFVHVMPNYQTEYMYVIYEKL